MSTKEIEKLSDLCANLQEQQVIPMNKIIKSILHSIAYYWI